MCGRRSGTFNEQTVATEGYRSSGQSTVTVTAGTSSGSSGETDGLGHWGPAQPSMSSMASAAEARLVVRRAPAGPQIRIIRSACNSHILHMFAGNEVRVIIVITVMHELVGRKKYKHLRFEMQNHSHISSISN